MLKYLVFILSFSAMAGDVALENISKQDFEDLVGEFAAGFNHTSVTSASKLGKIFGFQLGIIGGVTQTETLDKLIKAADPGSEGRSSLPTAGISGKVSTPFGISVEASMIPKFKVSGFEMKNFGVGLSYDLGNAFKIPFMNFGLKGTYTKTDLGFESQSSGSTIDADFSAKTSGVTLYVGKKFLIVEPYAGIGYVTTDGELSGSASFFNYTSSDTADAKKSGAQVIVGANLNLLAFKFGAEYTSLLGTSKIVGKLNFGF